MVNGTLCGIEAGDARLGEGGIGDVGLHECAEAEGLGTVAEIPEGAARGLVVLGVLEADVEFGRVVDFEVDGAVEAAALQLALPASEIDALHLERILVDARARRRGVIVEEFPVAGVFGLFAERVFVLVVAAEVYAEAATHQHIGKTERAGGTVFLSGLVVGHLRAETVGAAAEIETRRRA